jgi:hypothetical protein
MFSKHLTRYSRDQERKSNWCETGHMFESSFVGECRVSWNGQFVNYKESLEMVRKNQPKDAVHERGSILIAEIAAQLDVAEHELRLLTAVGSPLDKFHGADAVVEFRGMVAPVDFKVRNLDNPKAIVIRPSDVGNGLKFAAFRIVRFFMIDAKSKGIAL